jgi:hypothetical protein
MNTPDVVFGRLFKWNIQIIYVYWLPVLILTLMMKIRNYAKFILAFAGCLWGCDEGENKKQSPVRLLTISVSSLHATAESDDWIILHSPAGEVVSFKPFESGDQLVFETEKSYTDDKINVTVLTYYFEGETKSYGLNSYLEIATGDQLEIGAYLTEGDQTNIGSFDLNLEGFTSPDQLFVSSKYSRTCNGTDTKMSCDISETGRDYLVQATVGGNLRYTLLENVQPNDQLSVSFSELSPFDQEINFKFPKTSNVFLMVFGREPDQTYLQNGYMLNYHFGGDEHTTIKAGYLNWLTKFETILRLSYPTHNYSYNKRGGVPSPDIEWPSVSDYTLVSRDVLNFSASAVGPFEWRSSSWSYLKPRELWIYWQVVSPGLNQTFLSLPEDITSKHPDLDIAKLGHTNTAFYTRKSYSNYIHEVVKGGRYEKEGEQLGIHIR